MRLSVHAFAAAGSSVASVSYLLCALLLYYIPEATIRLIAPVLYVKHPSFIQDMIKVTLQDTVTGVLLCMIGVYIVLYVFAVIYNRLA